MLSLRKMTRAEYEVYHARSVQTLAAALVEARRLLFQDAIIAAQKSFTLLLPEGSPDASDQYLYTLIDGEQKLGVLWFGIKREMSIPEVYVWDLMIEVAHRRKGYGRQAMLALEDEVKRLGMSRIALNVFEHNIAAQRLYEQLGYRSVSRMMMKEASG